MEFFLSVPVSSINLLQEVWSDFTDLVNLTHPSARSNPCLGEDKRHPCCGHFGRALAAHFEWVLRIMKLSVASSSPDGLASGEDARFLRSMRERMRGALRDGKAMPQFDNFLVVNFSKKNRDRFPHIVT